MPDTIDLAELIESGARVVGSKFRLFQTVVFDEGLLGTPDPVEVWTATHAGHLQQASSQGVLLIAAEPDEGQGFGPHFFQTGTDEDGDAEYLFIFAYTIARVDVVDELPGETLEVQQAAVFSSVVTVLLVVIGGVAVGLFGSVKFLQSTSEIEPSEDSALGRLMEAGEDVIGLLTLGVVLLALVLLVNPKAVT